MMRKFELEELCSMFCSAIKNCALIQYDTETLRFVPCKTNKLNKKCSREDCHALQLFR